MNSLDNRKIASKGGFGSPFRSRATNSSLWGQGQKANEESDLP